MVRLDAVAQELPSQLHRGYVREKKDMMLQSTYSSSLEVGANHLQTVQPRDQQALVMEILGGVGATNSILRALRPTRYRTWVAL